MTSDENPADTVTEQVADLIIRASLPPMAKSVPTPLDLARALHDAGLLADPADQHRCHVTGCVRHFEGMHVDRAGDAIVHHAQVCPECYEQVLQQRDSANAEVTRLKAERDKQFMAAVARVTPCTCSAQRARAERAEAEVAELRAMRDRVRALADDWEHEFGPGSEIERVMGKQSVTIKTAVELIRAALDGSGRR